MFAALAFLQALNEPTEGLLAQPVRSLQKSWGQPTSAIALFSALLALPWLLKPLFGLLSDFVPLGGTRRRGYLLLAAAASAVALVYLFAFPLRAGSSVILLTSLLVPTAAAALADVATDALMVEHGQRLDATGGFQAVHSASTWSAGIVAGIVGGELAHRDLERWAFLVCGLAAVVSLAVVARGVREAPRRSDRPAGAVPSTRLAAAHLPRLLGVGLFLFLWNFNPFSNTVLHMHFTTALGFSERFYGAALSLWAAAALGASLLYASYCRRLSMRRLARASIGLGIASTLVYLLAQDELTALAVTVPAGFCYTTATLIQLDMAARICPPGAAATVFALLMAVENLAIALSTWLGGLFYDRASVLGSHRSFAALLAVSAVTTACCWPLLRVLPTSLFENEVSRSA